MEIAAVELEIVESLPDEEERHRASRLVDFVKGLVRHLMDGRSGAIGSLSIETLPHCSEKGLVHLKGEFRLQNSLHSTNRSFPIKNSEFQHLASRLGFSVETVEAVEMTTYAGYEMYSVRHRSQKIEGVFYDITCDEMVYEVWKS